MDRMTPRMTLVVSTFFPDSDNGAERARVALSCVRSWRTNIRRNVQLNLHVSDDGSPGHTLETFLDGVRFCFQEFTHTRQERRGLGASLNAGFRQAYQSGHLALYVPDDFYLASGIDLAFAANLMEADPDIGMVRIGLPHPDITGTIRHFPGIDDVETFALVMDPHHYVMGQRPSLYHRRMFDAIGPFKEGVSALACEADYNDRWLRDRPFKAVQWIPNLWEHRHTIELGDIDPC